MNFLTNFWWLLCAHAVCDYALQSQAMSMRKNPRLKLGGHAGPWWWSMRAHSLINGAGVSLVTGIWWLGVAESVVHFIADTSKCLGRINTEQDQITHLISKVVWALCAF